MGWVWGNDRIAHGTVTFYTYTYMATATAQDALANLAAKLVAGGSGVRLADLGQSLISSVTIESQVAPPVSFAPFASTDGGAPQAQPTGSSPLANMVLRYIRPKITLETAGGEVPFAPWGEPNGSWLPGAVSLVSGVAALTAWALGRKDTAKTLGYVAAGGLALAYLTNPQTAGGAA